jgi:hypothetical protein
MTAQIDNGHDAALNVDRSHDCRINAGQRRDGNHADDPGNLLNRHGINLLFDLKGDYPAPCGYHGLLLLCTNAKSTSRAVMPSSWNFPCESNDKAPLLLQE